MEGFNENSTNELNFSASLCNICQEIANLEGDKNKIIAGIDILTKLLTNIVKQPSETKFRNFKITNEALKSKVLSLPKAIDLIEHIGYIKSSEEFYTYDKDDITRLHLAIKELNNFLNKLEEEIYIEKFKPKEKVEDKGERVILLQYDISQGMARSYSPMLIGKVIEGVWHTSLIVYGKEYYFGGGICEGIPRKTPYGRPLKETKIGTTDIPLEMFKDYLIELRQKFNVNSYNILNNNCNHFTNEISFFLTGNNVPDNILNQHKELNNTPMGKMILPMLEKMNQNNSQSFPNMFEGKK